MVTRTAIRHRTYQDSVKLMRICTEVKALPGVDEAVCIMGTARNKAALEASGLMVPEAASAGPDDLLILVRTADEPTADRAMSHVEALLAETSRQTKGLAHQWQPRTLGSALRKLPGLNLALISVPGPYAAAEALRALRHGMHVHLFSDNVSVEDEIALKRMGRDRGLLVMGPDCGTAMIAGVPLGFANAVPRGPVGIVGASGTGIQEVSVLLGRLGTGVSHAIGTGGRDLSDSVGGVMTLMALDALERDPGTGLVILISKPPGPQTLERVLSRVTTYTKPVVAAFLGGDCDAIRAAGALPARTLEEAAVLAAGTVLQRKPEARTSLWGPAANPVPEAEPGQRYLRGLFTGGTLADEAILVLRDHIGPVYSNVSVPAERRLPNPWESKEHTVVDLGEDEFTRGRPHPMIDPSLRADRIVREASDPEVAVLLCDVVLGYGAHPDPAGAVANAVGKARAESGRHVTVVASVCGTALDPQDLERQESTLRGAGILVCPSNAQAADLAGRITRDLAERGAL